MKGLGEGGGVSEDAGKESPTGWEESQECGFLEASKPVCCRGGSGRGVQ